MMMIQLLILAACGFAFVSYLFLMTYLPFDVRLISYNEVWVMFNIIYTHLHVHDY